MNLKTYFSHAHRSWQFGSLVMLLFFLSACSPSSKPLEITSVKVSPEPVVGQIVTLEVKIQSSFDQSGVIFTTDTYEEHGNKVHLISGDSSWEGSLTANQPQTFTVTVCVLEEGSWAVEFLVYSFPPGYDGLVDTETIHLESTLESGKLIPARDFRISQQDLANRPTPRPFDVPIECSGNSK